MRIENSMQIQTLVVRDAFVLRTSQPFSFSCVYTFKSTKTIKSRFRTLCSLFSFCSFFSPVVEACVATYVVFFFRSFLFFAAKTETRQSVFGAASAIGNTRIARTEPNSLSFSTLGWFTFYLQVHIVLFVQYVHFLAIVVFHASAPSPISFSNFTNVLFRFVSLVELSAENSTSHIDSRFAVGWANSPLYVSH